MAALEGVSLNRWLSSAVEHASQPPGSMTAMFLPAMEAGGDPHATAELLARSASPERIRQDLARIEFPQEPGPAR